MFGKCPACGGHKFEFGETIGSLICSNCGRIDHYEVKPAKRRKLSGGFLEAVTVFAVAGSSGVLFAVAARAFVKHFGW